MSKTTLEVRPLQDGDRVGRPVRVDCRHGTTHIIYSEGQGPNAVRFTDVQLAALAVAKHYDEEGCRCTRRLRRRYGVVMPRWP